MMESLSENVSRILAILAWRNRKENGLFFIWVPIGGLCFYKQYNKIYRYIHIYILFRMYVSRISL